LDDLTKLAESEPGMELGVPQQVNLALPSSALVYISFPELATEDYVGISEVCKVDALAPFPLRSL